MRSRSLSRALAAQALNGIFALICPRTSAMAVCVCVQVARRLVGRTNVRTLVCLYVRSGARALVALVALVASLIPPQT